MEIRCGVCGHQAHWSEFEKSWMPNPEGHMWVCPSCEICFSPRGYVPKRLGWKKEILRLPQ